MFILLDINSGYKLCSAFCLETSEVRNVRPFGVGAYTDQQESLCSCVLYHIDKKGGIKMRFLKEMLTSMSENGDCSISDK